MGFQEKAGITGWVEPRQSTPNGMLAIFRIFPDLRVRSGFAKNIFSEL
jgi:hypothetical protein